MGIGQGFQDRCGLRRDGLGQDRRHAGGKIGAGDETETAKHEGSGSIQIPVAEFEARPYLQVLDLEFA